MKKHAVCVLFIMIFLTGCSARVGIGLNNNGSLKFTQASGKVSPERGLDILERQSEVSTEIFINKEIQLALKNGDQDRVNELIRIKNGLTTSTDTYRFLPLVNNSGKYYVEILNGPFKGVKLYPGMGTKAKKISVGVKKISFFWRDQETHKTGTKTITITVQGDRTSPLEIY